MQYQVCVLDDISSTHLEMFPTVNYQITTDALDPHLLLVRSRDLHEYCFQSQLLAVGRAGAGVNNIPVAKLAQQGIVIFNTPGANANAVKELVIAGMLMASRHLYQACRFIGEVASSLKMEEIERQKKRFVGQEIAGKTVGVIGLGKIGVQVANAALGLGMHVMGFDPTITVENSWQLSSSVVRAPDVGTLLARSDFITVHVPLNEKTNAFINQKAFSQMRPSTVLLNFSRAAVVDKQALLSALQNKSIQNYVTDFPDPDFFVYPQVLALPHLGASTEEAKENCARMLIQQLVDFMQTGSIKNAVNLPDIEMPRGDGQRLAIINRNIPNMVSQISTVIAKHDLNIIDLINRSRGDYAYTLIDVAGALSDRILQEIAAITGIIRARRVF